MNKADSKPIAAFAFFSFMMLRSLRSHEFPAQLLLRILLVLRICQPFPRDTRTPR